jgi:predicted RNase H-like nuclease (RuvC/YqgF family)
MSQESQESKSKSSTLVKVLIPLVVIQMGIIIFLLVNWNKEKATVADLNQAVQTKTSEVELKAQELENLGAQFERIKAEREKLGLANDSLDVQLTSLKTKVAELRKSGKLDANKRKELEQMVSKLREEITKRDQEIADLQSKNDSLNSDLQVTKTEKAKLGDSLTNVASKKQDLDKKLAYASILKTQEFKVTVLKENGKEIDDDVYKASKINRLKVVFSLADNKAADQNDKDFFLRLVTPNGDAFSDPANGGGTIGLIDGTSVNYTQKQTLKFDNTNQKVTFVSLSGIQYVPGTYTVEIYCEGSKIGQGDFKVK